MGETQKPNEQRESRRFLERTLLSLPVNIHCRDSDCDWDEVSTIIDATPFGARLGITRPLGPGRLLRLEMDLPRQLRCFDHDEPRYRTWALVRHLRQLGTAHPSGKQFEVGVAFTGKQLPLAAVTDPTTEYRITSEATEESLWGVGERYTPAEKEFTGERRVEARLPFITDVMIEVYDGQGRVSAAEIAKTENISSSGMAVVSELNLVRGRYVRVRSPEFNIAVIAAVRRLRRGADGRKHLHLEFVDQQWPAIGG